MTHGEAPIEVVQYDPAWPALFREERRELQRVLAPWLAGSIEHIGSTAVPGIAAKPVIDIMAGVSSLEASRPAIEAAATLRYCYFPYQPDLEHWFCKPSPALRTHHLHLVPVGSAQWVRPIAFREYLRVHSDVAAEYEELKRGLALRFRLDREAYTDAKRPFIDAVTEKAIAAGFGPAPSRPFAQDFR
ncbi:MAG: GrpB family protein [Vicinamibacterales bacterium]